MIDLTAEFVYDGWSDLKQDIPDKNKETVARDFLISLENHGAIDYEVMIELKSLDDDLKYAVECIYTDDDDEDDGYDLYDEDMDY